MSRNLILKHFLNVFYQWVILYTTILWAAFRELTTRLLTKLVLITPTDLFYHSFVKSVTVRRIMTLYACMAP
jgi:hypothetical protein